MAEAHDENSINTDLTFESGDENVSIAIVLYRNAVFLHMIHLHFFSTSGRYN